MKQAEDFALAFGKREGEGSEERAIEGDPERGGVHFVFGKLEFAVADVFVGEEFDFLEADHLRTDEDVSVGARRHLSCEAEDRGSS